MLWGHNCSDGNYPLSLAIDINESVLLANATAGAKISASPASWPSRFEFENQPVGIFVGGGKVDWILFWCWCLMYCRGCEQKKKSRKPITKQIVSLPNLPSSATFNINTITVRFSPSLKPSCSSPSRIAPCDVMWALQLAQRSRPGYRWIMSCPFRCLRRLSRSEATDEHRMNDLLILELPLRQHCVVSTCGLMLDPRSWMYFYRQTRDLRPSADQRNASAATYCLSKNLRSQIW